MRNFWNMPDKKKETWVFRRHSLPSVFSQTGSSCVPLYSHLTLVAWSTPLDYHCSFPFSLDIGDSLSVTGRTVQASEGEATSAWLDWIWCSRSGAVVRAVCIHLCLAKRQKKALLVSLLHGGQETTGGSLKQTECRCLWCAGKKMDVERRGANRWRDGGDNKLFCQPDNHECYCSAGVNATGLGFSAWLLKHVNTSSPPWERRMSWQSQCLSLPLVSVSVSCCPHFCLVCALLFPFVLIVHNTRWRYFPSFQNGKKSIWVICSLSLLSKAWNTCHLSGKS